MNFQDSDEKYSLKFRPNTSINMGVGATYKWATLNLAFGFPFLNPDNNRGKTRYLDLQFHSYGRKITLDVLGQFYKGFYLAPRGTAAPAAEPYYLRPDLKINAVGATLQYIFNHKKFSYRAAFLQNEWQKKSAGSIVLGFELYAGSIAADSSIVPTAIDPEIAITNVNKLRFVELGPNVGYAYSFVFKKNYFITGAASISLNAGINSFYDKSGTNTVTGVSPNTLYRIGGGYNSGRWAASAFYVSNSLFLISDEVTHSVGLTAGNFRVGLVYRFKPPKMFKKYLKVIDEVDEEIIEKIEN